MLTATDIRVTFLSASGNARRQTQLDVSEFVGEDKVPAPKYRHATPSAPWPWMDFDKDAAFVQQFLPGAPHPWEDYPQSHFGNWTQDQVQRCRMLTICQSHGVCQIHKVDVYKNGKFRWPDEPRRILPERAAEDRFWDEIQGTLDPSFRVQALFVEDISLNVLRILGARYNIEPFFFASAANWIPSRYQEDPQDKEGDHITVVLPFIRTVNNQLESKPLNQTGYPPRKGPTPITDTKLTIDTQVPLVLSDQKILIQDLLAIHMVRSRKQNIVISYHHQSKLQQTTAMRLQSLVQRTGDSVYWQKIYGRSQDPTFVFLAILWYALYAWDEALEVLYAHLTSQLESVDVTTHLKYARELQKLQANLLYYQQLLRDFEKSVKFVQDTPNPAMNHNSISKGDRKRSQQLLKQETNNLLSEIRRLEKQRQIQSDRVRNAMQLTLTEATVRDSAAMKQIAYLTMIFLPASYLASVFGMNVAEINPNTYETLAAYIESTVILTVITAWVVVALQPHSSFHPGGRNLVRRIAWPIYYTHDLIQTMMATWRSVTACNAQTRDTAHNEQVHWHGATCDVSNLV